MAVNAQAVRQTADAVARLTWTRAVGQPRTHLGLPARLTLRAAAGDRREGARAVPAAAAAELIERALDWHQAAARHEEPVALATLAGDFCLARASAALAGQNDLRIEAAFADGLSAASVALLAGQEPEVAARQLLPACALAGSSAGRLPASLQARWRRAGVWLAGPVPSDPAAMVQPADVARLRAAPDPVERRLGSKLATDPASVAGPMATLLRAGGKRLRARLVLLAGEVGRVHDLDRLLEAAAAMELLHAATLCHDDLVDGAASRRGAPTVAHLDGPLAALAVGDYYLGRAAGLLSRMGDPRISHGVTAALVEIADAQLHELDRRAVWSGALRPYERVATGKTGALLAACAVTGARLAGAGSAELHALNRFARRLGLAFQGIDDCLDFADPARTGKPVGLDLAQGICSLPVICALRGSRRGEVLRQLRRMEQVEGEAATARAAVVALVRSSGALAAAHAVADRWSAEALDALGPLAPRARRRLTAFAERLVVRDR